MPSNMAEVAKALKQSRRHSPSQTESLPDFVMPGGLAKSHGALAKLRVEDALAAIEADRARRGDILAEALDEIVAMEGRAGMTDAEFVDRVLRLAYEVLTRARGGRQGEGEGTGSSE